MLSEEEAQNFSNSSARTGTTTDLLQLNVYSSPNERANDDVLLFEKTNLAYYDIIPQAMAIFIDEKSTIEMTQP